MRCISDELIQKYIDREVTDSENSLVQSHLLTCSICAEKVEERRYTAERIKGLVGSLNKNEVQVPLFKASEIQRKAPVMRLKWVAVAAAAACIPVLFLLFHQKPKDEIEFVYSYDLESEYNANLPLSEQEMVIEIMDSKGKLIKY